MHRHVARSVLASILLFLSLSWGQSDTGTITGTVKDTSASVIARVKITVTSISTKEKRVVHHECIRELRDQ